MKADDKELLRQGWQYLILNVRDRLLAYADENSGLDVGKISEILNTLNLSPRISSAGYADEERANLFSSNGSRVTAEIPPFLIMRILERLLQHKSSQSEEIAKQYWFWGYIWEGAKTKEIFNTWLGFAVDLGFATTREQGKYEFLALSELRGRIQAAENWLKDDYPQIVLKMQEVFGEGAIATLFDPREGTETAKAKDKIKRAKESLDKLERQENQYSQSSEEVELPQKRNALLEFARKRREIIAAIDYVYNPEAYATSIEDNAKTLKLHDKKESLWFRIRRAELFTDRVLKIRDRIFERIDTLGDRMRSQVKDIPDFPVQLFTLSFEKIRHILEGAIRNKNPEGSTARQQMTDSKALGQCLKDLRVAEAMEQLKKLSREVGLNIESASIADIPFAEIDGQIVKRFCRFQQTYTQLHQQLADSRSRLHKLQQKLENAPSSFQYPSDLEAIGQLQLKLELIEDSLASVREDEVEGLRDDPLYDQLAKQGNFQPLMKAADSLLNAPKSQLQQLRSKILTLENEINSFIGKLLEGSDLQSVETSFNQLLTAKGKQPQTPLSRLDLERTDSLAAAVEMLAERRSQLLQEGNQLLPEGIRFERWQAIVAAIEQGKDPDLATSEEEPLLRSGLLVRTYRLGGD